MSPKVRPNHRAAALLAACSFAHCDAVPVSGPCGRWNPLAISADDLHADRILQLCAGCLPGNHPAHSIGEHLLSGCCPSPHHESKATRRKTSRWPGISPACRLGHHLADIHHCRLNAKRPMCTSSCCSCSLFIEGHRPISRR